MATKYQHIIDLYAYSLKQVTEKPSAWTAFLRSACLNYKCRFDEQLLIYAQRPDATAVLEIERWNKFGRRVNKGAVGIAVFDDEHSGKTRLKHYFDISDTHETPYARPVPMWSMDGAYEADVIETLTNSFGDIEDDSALADALIAAAKNSVSINMSDYFRDFMYCCQDSLLDGLDEYNIEVEYTTLLQNSIAYMLLTRCGVDANEYLNANDFRFIGDFNTRQTMTALGTAMSDIAESCLREVADTVLNLQRTEKNPKRTFAIPQKASDNIPTITNERSFEDGIDLSHGGSVLRSEPDRAGRAGSNPWQVRPASQIVPEKPSQGAVYSLSDGGNAERTPVGNRTDGDTPHGADGERDGGGAGRDRADESREPNGVGGQNEQHSPQRGGSDTGGANLRIKPLPTETAQQLNIFGEAEVNPSAFAISQQIIDEVLTSGGNGDCTTLRIAAYFKKNYSLDMNAAFLKAEYKAGGKGFMFGGERVSVWFDKDGIRIAHDDTTRTPSAMLVTWVQAATRTRELLDLGRYMPQSQLDKVDSYELKNIADNIWYLHQDRAGGYEFSFMDADLFLGFPNSTAKIAELLTQPDYRQTVLDGLREFAEEYEENHDLLRFRFAVERLYDTIAALEGLEREPLVFAADEGVTTSRPSFITEDEIDAELSRGSHFRDGKFRIYSYFLGQHTSAEKVSFLRREYGSGGGGIVADMKGIPISREVERMPYDKILLPWNKVASRIDALIADGRYMSQAELNRIPEYEKDILAREIYHFYTNKPEDVPRPYERGADFYKAVRAIRPQLDEPERVAEILNNMAAVLDNTADFDRDYQSMQTAFRDLTAYQKGEYSLFNGRLPTKAETPHSEPQTSKPNTTTPEPAPVDDGAKYDLQLGCTIYIGADEYELQSISDTIVILRDMSAPLFTLDLDRDVFDRRLHENPLNDGLKNTSALQAYKQIKRENADSIVMYQVGDFFEFYGEDAELVAQTLDIVLFSRNMGGKETPMCGIPSHKQDDYLKLLTEAGYSVVVAPTGEREDTSKHGESIAEAPLKPSWEQPVPIAAPLLTLPEIPMSERHNYRITDNDLGVGGQKTKYKCNVEAIKLLRLLEAENRLSTPDEQDILARYVGWGGLPQAFDADHAQWTNEYMELKSLLTDDEYTSARASTLNAHYTSPTVIKAIYKAVENIGFKTGTILEPSCGIGNFFGLLPDSMADSKLYGVELDSLTGRIARQLYQRNSIAIQGYEKTKYPDSFFDLAIGNVPFGNYTIPDRKYDRHKFSIHDYFFAKALDQVRPGGVVAFITSKYMMDAKNPAVRKYIAQRAELLGAIRLPSNAFQKNAGTEVTTDIIFLQKRDRMVDIEPDWLHLGKTEGGIPVNSYFADNPDMVLGEMVYDDMMYGNRQDTVCRPYEDADLAELLDEAVTNIHGEVTDYERDEDEPTASVPADPNVRNFAYTIVNGQIYYRHDSIMLPRELPLTVQNRVKGMIAIRECVRDLIRYQTDNYPDSVIQSEQAKLNRLYDAYTKKYDLLNSRGNSIAFSEDESYPLLCSLELLDEDGNLKSKAAMFTRRTINPYTPITHADTAADALALSISEKARVDLDYMSELTGAEKETLVKELEGVIFRVPVTDKYETADAYLSGNVREKLARAREYVENDTSFQTNVTALEAVQPKELTAAEISVRLGSTWIPPDVIQQFVHELVGADWRVKDRINVLYSPSTAEWNITEKSADKSNVKSFQTYGTKRLNAYHIIERTLNLRTVRVFDTVIENGKETQVLNKKETAIAQDKQELIKQKFSEWIWQDPERREMLCRLYNERFNSNRPREFDGRHINFVGMNPEIQLDTHQRNAVARFLYGGNALFAHTVGAGKTFEMIAAAMEAKRLGLCTKPMFVVPNNIIGDFTSDFFRLYPAANVLMTTAKDFEKKNRKKFCARIATGDYDGVVIAHSQFEKIPMSAERQALMLRRQINDIERGIEEIKEQNGEKYTIKQMEKMRKSLEAKLEKLNDQSRKDDLVTFEELGVDMILVDEADLFKNLFVVTKMRNVAGVSQTESQKAFDLFMKTQYLDERTDERGTIFATGTPISNSLSEMYTMQRYLQYSTLKKHGLEHFDCWASTFGETKTAMELAPEGTGFQLKTRFSSFYNLPELIAMFKQVADIQTKDMLNLPTPKVNYEIVVTKPSEMQQEMIESLADRADKIRNREVEPTEDNMLLVTNDGRKIALDQRIINPMLPDHEGSKVNACVANVYRIWEQHKDMRLTQLVFSDLSTPKGDGSFNVYDDIKQKLIAKGVPESEIVFIHDANTEAQKQELFAKVRVGAVRVLMGSTSKMGAGTNVQDLLIASHDLDCRATRS